MKDDIAAARKIAANIEMGRDEWVPSEIVATILDGENPIRIWRKHRG